MNLRRNALKTSALDPIYGLAAYGVGPREGSVIVYRHLHPVLCDLIPYRPGTGYDGEIRDAEGNLMVQGVDYTVSSQAPLPSLPVDVCARA